MESTGVMPLPAAKAAKRLAPPAGVGVEAAVRGHDLHALAGHAERARSDDMRPPGCKRMPIVSDSAPSGLTME